MAEHKKPTCTFHVVKFCENCIFRFRFIQEVLEVDWLEVDGLVEDAHVPVDVVHVRVGPVPASKTSVWYCIIAEK